MKEEARYRWRVQWAGKWKTTNHHCTEEHILREHPEAQCLEHTREVHQVPETEQEICAVAKANFTSGFMRR
jgi:hypothetical protein